jgi:hypothetical protein
MVPSQIRKEGDERIAVTLSDFDPRKDGEGMRIFRKFGLTRPAQRGLHLAEK